jgi:hypothetical protein
MEVLKVDNIFVTNNIAWGLKLLTPYLIMLTDLQLTDLAWIM